MSSVERSMDTTLPGMVMEDFTVDKQVPVNMTLSEGTNVAIEQHAKAKKSKGKGGFIKRAWKAVKRPFRRSSHETNVEAMVPDTAIPCTSSDGEEIRAQLSSVSGPCKLPTAALPPKEDRCGDLDVVSITSSDWSVICNNIQQNSEPPADASSEDVETEPQEQHGKEEKKKEKEEKMKKKEKEKEEKKEKKKKEKEEKEKKKEKEKEEKKKAKEEKKKAKEEKMKKKENEKELKKEQKKKEKEEKKKEKEDKKKGNGPFLKRVWKGVKRPFRRRSHETNVEAMVPDTSIPCASSDGEEIRPQLSSVSGPCKPPTAALPPKETETQEQHVKEEKKDHIDFSLRVEIFLHDQRWKLKRLRMGRNRCRRRLEYYMYIRRCPHHRCCDHDHLCCLRNDTIFLGAREQLMSTVPSVTRPFLIFPKQSRNEPFREHNPEDEDDIEKEGIFKRNWKAVKRRLFRWESKRTLLLKNMPECDLDSQESTYIERPIYDRPSLSVPPMFQPTKAWFDSSYKDEYVILGIERFGQVCLATRLSDGKKVAYKRLLQHQYATSTYIMAGYTERLMNEVAMMTLLKQPPISPYIMQMSEWFHDGYQTCIIYEDPGSWTVLEKILILHPLGEKVARVIMRQAVQAAQHCIAHGVFHYFIDDQNILINMNTLEIKLFDFGYSMPYMGKKYYRLGDTVEYEEKHPEWSVPGHEYSAISVNVYQLGSLLEWMVWRSHDHQMMTYFPMSYECRTFIEWCKHYQSTKRPTLEQILQHRWFTKE